MKKIIIGLIAFILISISCKKDFLDKKPIDSATLESLFSDADNLKLAINGIYDVFQGGVWAGSFYHLAPHTDGISEDAVLCCDWEAGFKLIPAGTILASSGGVVSYKWWYGYMGISRANAVLAHIDNPQIVLSDDVRTKYKAEVRFLRGLIYFELTNNYGDVPLILEPVEISKAKVSRNKKEEVIKAVLEDLDFAAANLGTTPLNGEIGRPVKQSAVGIKARVLLYQSRWAEAAEAAKQVMDMESSGATGLSSNYEGLFNGTNKTDKEVLFAIQFRGASASSADVGEGNYLTEHYGPINVETGGGWGSLTYEETMFDAFYMKDGLPKDRSPLFDPANPYANRDKRLYWSFFVPGFAVWDGKPYTEANYNGTIPELPLGTKKWVCETDNDANSGSANFIILRYADVLLMYAEAQNETAGPDASIYEAINKVRARAEVASVTPGLSQGQLRDVIWHERKVEFSQEGLRYFDLIRWGTAKQLINSNKRSSNNWHDYNALLPIPQSEMNANHNLVQNPGYPQ